MTPRAASALMLVVCLAGARSGWSQQLASQAGVDAAEAVDGGTSQAGPSQAGSSETGSSETLETQTAAASLLPSAAGASADGADAAAGGESAPVQHPVKRPDFNSDIYYRNKVEFSLESGVLPINLPFVFDVFVGGNYALSPQHYTLVPVFPSLRWQMGDVHGPWFLRGNTDMTFTLSVTAIPRGPENLYDALDLGFRRNFVQRNWRVAPYFEVRIGAGFLNAQEPYGDQFGKGVLGNGFAQGEDFTFTLMMGSGFRYNFNSRYSMAIGATYFHVSNAYLSEPKYDDNGINVVGPLLGFNVRLSKPREH